MSVLSDELNLLIYKYLQESGFNHSAFTFYMESNLTSSSSNHVIPPGALVTAVQKGLQYVQAEIGINEEGSCFEESEQPLSLIHAMSPDYVASRISSLQQRVKPPPPPPRSLSQDQIIPSSVSIVSMPVASSSAPGVGVIQEAVVPRQPLDGLPAAVPPSFPVPPSLPVSTAPSSSVNEVGGMAQVNSELVARQPDVVREDFLNGPHSHHHHHEESMDVDVGQGMPAAAESSASGKVILLKGHEGDVFVCAWNPICDLLASGSGDATARLWDCSELGEGEHLATMYHVNKDYNQQNCDVTSMEWNHDGSLLATGFYDGKTRIWARDGSLLHCLTQHQGPVLAVKWNRKGNFIASGGVDKNVIVWEAHTGEVKQQFQFHQAPALDLDWQSNTCLASCSTDRLVYVCKLGQDKPVRIFKGHENEVNTVKWDPAGSFLASCSDDTTAKIWSLKEDNFIHSLHGHLREIHTVRWSPSGPGSNNPHAPLLLASASFDATVRLWDVEKGACLRVLASHHDGIYGLAFSPNGLCLATGSSDTLIRLWSTHDGKIVHSFSANSPIFEVCWNRDGDKLAACGADNTLFVLDVSKLAY